MKYSFMVLGMAFLLLLTACSNPSIGIMPTNTTVLVEQQGSSNLITQDFLFAIQTGEIPGAYIIHKFGANDAVGNTLEPITTSGFYRTPTNATSLEVVSDSINDVYGGSGAWRILIIGLNASGHEVQEEVLMNGTTPNPLTNTYLRVYRAYITESGTYATQTVGSHVGTLTIQETGGGQIWSQIGLPDGFPAGQTEIGAYTTPKGFNCFILKKVISVNAAKTADVYFFQRQNITDNNTPYSTMRLVEKHIGLSNTFEITSRSAITMFPELTDIGYLGHTHTGTAEVSVEFELVCLDNVMYPMQ